MSEKKKGVKFVVDDEAELSVMSPPRQPQTPTKTSSMQNDVKSGSMHPFWLTFNDNDLENRYTHFAYVHSGFYGGKLWHAVAFIIVLLSFFYYHSIRHGFSGSMFISDYWIAMTITGVATLSMFVCCFIESLYPYREWFFLISLFTHWPAFTIALMFGLGKPFVYTIPVLSGCFFFCAFVVQARFSRVVWFLTASPILTLIISTTTFPYDFWKLHDVAEIVYWGVLFFPVSLLYFYEVSSRKYYIQMERCEDTINQIEQKIESTRNLIAHFFPFTPTKHLLSDGAVQRCKHYEHTGMIVTDLAGFTAWTSRTEPTVVIETLGEMFNVMDSKMAVFGVEKISTVGDCLIAGVFPRRSVDVAQRCHNTILYSLAILPHGGELLLRIGAHIGNMTGGFVGGSPPKFEVFGEDVDTVKLLEQMGVPGKVHCSSQMMKLVHGEAKEAEPTSMGGIALSGWTPESKEPLVQLEQENGDENVRLLEKRRPDTLDLNTFDSQQENNLVDDDLDVTNVGFSALEVFNISKCLVEMGNSCEDIAPSAIDQHQHEVFSVPSLVNVESTLQPSLALESSGQQPTDLLAEPGLHSVPSPLKTENRSNIRRNSSQKSISRIESAKNMLPQPTTLVVSSLSGSYNNMQNTPSLNRSADYTASTASTATPNGTFLLHSSPSRPGFLHKHSEPSPMSQRESTGVSVLETGSEGGSQGNEHAEVKLEEFHPILLSFSNRLTEAKFRLFLHESQLVDKSQFILMLLQIFLALAHMLLGCFDTMRNRLLFGYIILVLATMMIVFRKSAQFKGSTVFICGAYTTMAFASLFQTATCREEGEFYTGLITAMYILMCILVTQFCLNKKQKFRFAMNLGVCVFGYVCNAVRTWGMGDDVLPFDLVWVVGFLGLAFVSYFADFSLRSAFAADRHMKKLLKVSKGRHHQATKAALDIMLPSFVSARLLGEEKRAKTQQENSDSDNDDTSSLLGGSLSLDKSGLMGSGVFEEDVVDTSNLSIADKLWDFRGVCVMFVSFKFESRGTQEHFIDTIHQTFLRMETVLRAHGIYKIKTISTCMMCVNGILDEVDCVEHMMAAAVEIKSTILQARLGWDYSVGAHYGPAMGAVLGTESLMFDIFGDTVNMASRMMSNAQNRAIQVTAAVNERCNAVYETVAREPIKVKGKGQVQPFEVTGRLACDASTSPASPASPAPLF